MKLERKLVVHRPWKCVRSRHHVTIIHGYVAIPRLFAALYLPISGRHLISNDKLTG